MPRVELFLFLKEIVIRSGFLDILRNKEAVGEILAADAVMADVIQEC